MFVEKVGALKIGALKIGKFYSFENWTQRSELLCSTITALILGTVFAYFANNDKFHNFARKKGITKETSYPSEWFGNFIKKENITYVVLQFEDERRLYGWLKEWPSAPDKGHFVLMDPSWLDDGKEIPITGCSSIMLNVKDVKWIEFMERTWEVNNGPKNS